MVSAFALRVPYERPRIRRTHPAQTSLEEFVQREPVMNMIPYCNHIEVGIPTYILYSSSVFPSISPHVSCRVRRVNASLPEDVTPQSSVVLAMW